MKNKFIKNTGWYRANTLNLRSSYSAGEQGSCLGYHLIDNLFFKNSNLPNDIAVVYLSCVYADIAQEDGIDDIDPRELNSNVKPVVGDKKQNLNVLKIKNQEIIIDYGYVQVRGNSFLQNYRGKGEGQIL